MIVRRAARSAAMCYVLLCAACLAWADEHLPHCQDTGQARGSSGETSKPPARKREGKPATRTGRDTMTLDGAWRFRAGAEANGSEAGWATAVPADAANVTVPSLWDRHGAQGDTGIIWYWREFDVPSRWQGQTVFLRFEGAAGNVEVWLNGQPLGEHLGGVLPFESNATPALRVGARNLLAVRLTGGSGLGSGLWQSVLLLAHDEAYITDCFPQGDASGNLNVPIFFTNLSQHAGDATLDARLVAADAPKRDLHQTSQNLHLTTGSNQTLLVTSIRGKLLRRWSPDSPALTRLLLVFRQDLDILDTETVAFGFRTLGYQDGAVTVNGVPVKLTIQDSPFFKPLYVLATPEEQERARGLLKGLKAQGISVLYLAAPPATLLRLTDEEGLLVVETTRPDGLASSRADEMRGLVLRDRAHPSILAWDLRGMDDDTARPLRDLDPTRFLVVGPASAPRLWPPDQNARLTAPLPIGLLPTP